VTVPGLTESEELAVHQRWMRLALKQAEVAAEKGEVPVGAVLVQEDVLLAEAHNSPILNKDPTAHAEISALRTAAAVSNNYRLSGAVLYVTIEPCTMCVGAIMHARIDTLVFGAREPRAGAVVSQQCLREISFFNHKLNIIEGVLAADCGELIREFFTARRNRGRHRGQRER